MNNLPQGTENNTPSITTALTDEHKLPDPTKGLRIAAIPDLELTKGSNKESFVVGYEKDGEFHSVALMLFSGDSSDEAVRQMIANAMLYAGAAELLEAAFYGVKHTTDPRIKSVLMDAINKVASGGLLGVREAMQS